MILVPNKNLANVQDLKSCVCSWILRRRVLVLALFLVYRLQLWRELLDGLAGEALRLRHVLGLPENHLWGDTHQELRGEYTQPWSY